MGPPTYRYHPFGAFRLFLAGLVAAQHYVANVGPPGPVRDRVLPLELGSLAVLAFFALSGFVITEAATKAYAGKPIEFFTNRLLRIVPHIAVAVITAVAMYAVFEHWDTLRLVERDHRLLQASDHAFSLGNIVANLLSWVPGIKSATSFEFISIMWAVRIEMIFYAVVALVLWLPPAHRARLPMLTPFVILGLTLATGLLHYRAGYALFFLYGVTLYRREWRWMLCCLPGMALYLVQVPGSPRAVGSEFVLLAGLFVVLTTLALIRTRRSPLDQRAGDLSYPVYIHHVNAEVFVLSLASGCSPSFGIVGVAALCALLLAWGLTLVVDPTINRLRDRIRGSQLEPATRRAMTI